ncbi:PREDICTED: uncharacterized protein C12orf50 homolog [Apaloderma vittatum]|uniref:uncharacterized protein C12orf50 homolog n=1 Tax=Apaloderma vittatum TaxID=57397 RepID=UPI0005218578|nr:PREDICTED: uncharacterized protein C12orf50 homolog [Apaloderma vittatum]
MEIKQKYSNISCFRETQPLGCVNIRCTFHHSKPCYINGLFLPLSNIPLSPTLQPFQVTRIGSTALWCVSHPSQFCAISKLGEGTLYPSIQAVDESVEQPLGDTTSYRPPTSLCDNASRRNQEDILLPIHPPLVININDEEDENEEEEDDEEEGNYLSNWMPKTTADTEEERAIKEKCYKTGEYYRIQYPHKDQSTKTMSSTQENELLPSEVTKQDLQKETNYTKLVKNHQCEEVKKKWISEELRNSPNRETNKGIHTSDRKVKPSCRHRCERKDGEAASFIPCGRQTGRKTGFSSAERRRSSYVVYRSVTQESKFSGSTDKYASGSYNAPTWRKGNPRAKMFSKF